MLTSIKFPELTGIVASTNSYSSTFGGNPQLKDMYFPKLSSITNQFMFQANCTALSGLHFAKVNEAAISASNYYLTHWGLGASKSSVLFDLNTDGTFWDGVEGSQY